MPIIVVGGIRCGTGCISDFFRRTFGPSYWLPDETQVTHNVVEKLSLSQIIGFKNARLLYSVEDIKALAKLNELVVVVVRRNEVDRLVSHISTKIEFRQYQSGYEAFNRNRDLIDNLRIFEVTDALIDRLRRLLPNADIRVIEYERFDKEETLNTLIEICLRFIGCVTSLSKDLKIVKPSRVSVMNSLPKKIRLKLFRYLPAFTTAFLSSILSKRLVKLDKEFSVCITKLLH